MAPDLSSVSVSSPDDSGPVVTIDNPSGATNDRSQTITGKLAEPAANVEGQIVTIDDDGVAIGRATVTADGTWGTDVLLSNIGANAITATATDAAGRSATSDPVNLTLETILTPPSAGGAARQDRRTIHPPYDAIVSAEAGSTSFVFRPHPGHAVVTGLDLQGPERDTLSFSCGSFSSFVDLIRHTTMSFGDAVIHLTPHDTVTLVGTAKSELRAERSAFAFHA